jgi:tetratricopeptide (TPR) repeat protein
VNKPSDELYQSVAQALQRGEGPSLLDAASALIELEGPTERAVVACAVVLMRSGKLDAARAGLESYLKQNGETAAVLTNLAKLHAEAGDESLALATARRALEHDPNYDGAVRWWAALLRKHSDDTAYRSGLKGLKGWYSKLLLADEAWRMGHDGEAERLLEEAVSEGQASAMVLAAQRLEARGWHDEVALLLKGWDPKVHGLDAGAALARAQISLGRFTEARETIRRLPGRVPALEQRLIESELLKLAPGEVRAVPIFAPLWASVLPEVELPPLGAEPRVALMTFSDTRESELCRAFPLAMSDAIRGTGVESYVVLPVVKGQGLVTTAQEWTLERALRFLPPRHLPRSFVLGRFVDGLNGERQLELDAYDLSAPGAPHRLRAFGKHTDEELLSSALKGLARHLKLPKAAHARGNDAWLAALAASLPVFLVGAGAIDASHLWHGTRGLEIALMACAGNTDSEPRLLAVALFVSGMRMDLPGFEDFRGPVLELVKEPTAASAVQALEELVRSA